MIGESGGVTAFVYQEQVSRENQIERDQAASSETEDSSSRQGAADVASFSAAALELARTAVSSVEDAPEVEDDQQSQEVQAAIANPERGSEPAQYLDIRA